MILALSSSPLDPSLNRSLLFLALMGNCQAAEAATVVIQHPGPGGRVERLYWSVTASHVMAANPGHYVAVIISSNASSAPHRDGTGLSSSCTTSVAVATTTAVKHLKLLRPDDTLQIGHVYRLVSFEEVLREFATKKRVKLSRLLAGSKERGRGSRRARARSDDGGGGRPAAPASSPATAEEVEPSEEEEVKWIGSDINSNSSRRGRGGGGAAARQGQWRPALQSISEVVGS